MRVYLCVRACVCCVCVCVCMCVCIQGLETLPFRGPRHAENTNQLAAWLSARDDVEFVSHPSLAKHQWHDAAKKYFRPGTFGAVLTFGIKGGYRHM